MLATRLLGLVGDGCIVRAVCVITGAILCSKLEIYGCPDWRELRGCHDCNEVLPICGSGCYGRLWRVGYGARISRKLLRMIIGYTCRWRRLRYDGQFWPCTGIRILSVDYCITTVTRSCAITHKSSTWVLLDDMSSWTFSHVLVVLENTIVF